MTGLRALLFGLLWLAFAGAATAGTYTLTSDRDSWINEGSVNQNNRTDTVLRATASNTGTNRTRPVIAFTLPAIPANEIITSAVLKLRVTTAGTAAVNVYRVTDTWVESTVTWANTATDFSATSLGSFTPSTNNVFHNIDITATVHGWRIGTLANNGVMLQSGNNSAARFASSENGTVANRPQLIITTAVVPAMTIVKSSLAYYDPLNGLVNPKAIPGGFIASNILVANPGAWAADSNSVAIVEATPANMEIYVAGAAPITFTNGTPSSALTFTFTSLASTTDDVEFSSNGGSTWTYVPTPDVNGVDAAVTHVRLKPKGSMAAASSFTLSIGYRVK
jgi:hypothetical protein